MKTLLVIPCYCESKRLPTFLPQMCDLLRQSELSVEVLLVDDGSPHEEQAALISLYQSLRIENSMLREPLLLPQNKGKGGAIRAGWDQGCDCDFLAFADADGAASAEETTRFLEIVNQTNDSHHMFIAVRDPRVGRNLERTLFRKMVASVFNSLIRIRYDIQVSDTQCGLKAIPGNFYRTVSRQLIQEGYAFDLELLLNAKRNDLNIVTVPIDWKEIPGSSANLRHALLFLRQIIFRSV